jgi:hypothetical protein
VSYLIWWEASQAGTIPAMPTPERASDFLTFDDVDQMLQAAAFANELGRPLNLLVTVHLESADLAGRWQEHRGRLLKLFQQWLAKHRHRWHAIWVAENQGDAGLHIHLLAHIPEDRQQHLKQRITRWIEKQLKGDPDRNTVHVRQVYDHGGIGYLLKGLHTCPTKVRTTVNGKSYLDSPADLVNSTEQRQQARAMIRRNGKPLWIPNKGPQGRISGKRYGTSEAIGQKARDSYWAHRQITRPATPTQPSRSDQAVA